MNSSPPSEQLTFAIRSRRLVQRALLKAGLWVTPFDKFRQAVAQTYYRTGEFSFVQVGANDGVSFDDFYWLVKKFNGRGLVIEPMADAFERLVHNYRCFPRVKPIRSAVHPTEKNVTLYRVKPDRLAAVPTWAFGSASIHPNWLPGQGVQPEDLEPEVVPAKPLMEILDENGIDSLDVLQIDVEGFDHEVICMVDFDRVSPRILKYESSQPDPANPDQREREMAEYLRARKYFVAASGMDTVALLRCKAAKKFSVSAMRAAVL